MDKAMKNLDRELEAIRREEEARAMERQAEAGIRRPVKLGFSANLSRELYDAGQRVWEAGGTAEGTRPRDEVLQKLWQQINRGLSCLTEADFLAFSQLPWQRMRVLAPELVEGETLAEALRKHKWTSPTPDRGAKKSR